MESARQALTRGGFLVLLQLTVTLFLRLPDGSTETDFTVVDPDVETAIRIRAHPGFVPDCSALASVIGHRDEYSSIAFLTFRKSTFHGVTSLVGIPNP